MYLRSERFLHSTSDGRRENFGRCSQTNCCSRWKQWRSRSFDCLFYRWFWEVLEGSYWWFLCNTGEDKWKSLKRWICRVRIRCSFECSRKSCGLNLDESKVISRKGFHVLFSPGPWTKKKSCSFNSGFPNAINIRPISHKRSGQYIFLVSCFHPGVMIKWRRFTTWCEHAWIVFE